MRLRIFHRRSEPSVSRTRTGAAWVGIALFSVVLLLLLIFILENGHQVDVTYFGFHGHVPLGIALLLAAVFGVLLIAIPGTARILQLRRAATFSSLEEGSTTAAPREPTDETSEIDSGKAGPPSLP
ncbi:lipopolysaccharide assembly LapA domain-containing protein [Kitasatospora sp. NPDC056076]|uniref:LapA family protein n=1 Tax=Kitasatospora sp. NPDC056076 TaxID=3345703 RepID=UPI0035D6BF84